MDSVNKYKEQLELSVNNTCNWFSHYGYNVVLLYHPQKGTKSSRKDFKPKKTVDDLEFLVDELIKCGNAVFSTILVRGMSYIKNNESPDTWQVFDCVRKKSIYKMKEDDLKSYLSNKKRAIEAYSTQNIPL
jgi:hypothetical protein